MAARLSSLGNWIPCHSLYKNFLIRDCTSKLEGIQLNCQVKVKDCSISDNPRFYLYKTGFCSPTHPSVNGYAKQPLIFNHYRPNFLLLRRDTYGLTICNGATTVSWSSGTIWWKGKGEEKVKVQGAGLVPVIEPSSLWWGDQVTWEKTEST